MKSKMIRYYQLVLKKVSFDKALFEKELIKSVRSIVLYEELLSLKQWCLKNFNDSYRQIVEQVFREQELKLGIV